MFYQGTILSERIIADALFERGWPRNLRLPQFRSGHRQSVNRQSVNRQSVSYYLRNCSKTADLAGEIGNRYVS
jgi:hypothetical protein